MCVTTQSLRKSVASIQFSKHATDDYQERKGGPIKSGLPDFIHQMSTTDVELLMFDFKNTDHDTAINWTKEYADYYGLIYTTITVGPGDDQKILNDWTRVTVAYKE